MFSSILLLSGFLSALAGVQPNYNVEESIEANVQSNAVVNYYYDDYSNNSENRAIQICEDNYYELDSYDSKVYGSIGYLDEYDHYYFKFLTTSYYSINFSILESNNYDAYDCYNYVDVKVYDYFTYEEIPMHNNSISLFDQKPSTYIICVNTILDYNLDISFDYEINLSVIKSNANYNNASIKDLSFNKGLEGAIWVSDYLPLYNLGDENKTIIYQEPFTANNTIKNTLDDLIGITDYEKLPFATYYLWGKELKNSLYDIYHDIYVKTSKECKDYERINIEVERQDEIINITYIAVDAAVTGILSSIPLTIPVNIIVSLGVSFVEYLIQKFISSQKINDVINKKDFLQTVNDILGRLDNSDDDEVIAINYFYNIDKINNTYKIQYFDETIDAEKTAYFYQNNDEYSSNKIDDNDYNIIYSNPVNQNSDYGNLTIINRIYGLNNTILGIKYYNAVRGKIYALNDFSFENLEFVSNYPNKDVEEKTIILDEYQSIEHLDNGEYFWRSIELLPGEYYIKTESFDEISIVYDMFSCKNNGYNNDYILGTLYSTNDMTYDPATLIYFSYQKISIEYKQTLHLRIHYDGYNKCTHKGRYIITTECTHIAHSEHNHSYMLGLYDNTHHKYTCSCGDFYLEPHAVKRNGKFCLACGARVDKGIIQQGLVVVIDDEYPNFLDENKVYVYFKKEEFDKHTGNMSIDENK